MVEQGLPIENTSVQNIKAVRRLENFQEHCKENKAYVFDDKI